MIPGLTQRADLKDRKVPVACTRITAVLVLIVSVLAGTPALSAHHNPLTVIPGTGKYELGPFMQGLRDNSGTLEISEVSSPKFTDRFYNITTNAINEGFTDTPFWFRFSIRTSENSETIETVEGNIGSDLTVSDWLLYLGKHLDYYDEIQVFWRTVDSHSDNPPQQWQAETFGMNSAVSKGQRDTLALRINLPDQPSQELQVYLRIQMVGGFFLEPTFYTPLAYHEFTKRLSIFYGAYFGIVVSMLIYNLFHYFFLRDKVRLLFILYASTICVYFLIANELALTIFPASFLPATRTIAQLLALVIMAQTIYFTIAFLDAKQTMPFGYWLLHGLAALSLLMIPLIPFFSYYELGPVLTNLGAIIIPVTMISGFIALRRGYRPARFYLIAWIFFMGGGLVYDLNFRGLFPYPFIGNNALQAGSAIEMILLSLAIADRVKFLFDKLHQAQLMRQERLNALTRKIVSVEEQERQRIAAILHDSIGQTLFATKWEVERLLKSISNNSAKDTKVLEYLDICISETRSLTTELYPKELYEFGLRTALVSLAADFGKKFDLVIQLTPGEEPEKLSEELKIVLYRSTSELLNNVCKHASAERVEIALEAASDSLVLSVKDDGIGFDYSPQNLDTSGFGLFSILERLNDIDGILSVESGESGGASVTITIPEYKQALIHSSDI